MKCIVLIAVIVASICWTASAFIPRVHRQNAGLVTVAMKRSSEPGLSRQILLPAAILPLILPCAVLAAEGTGRAFGIDDSRLVWAAITPALLILPLYAKWSKEQEPDDFFDGYEKRRNG